MSQPGQSLRLSHCLSAGSNERYHRVRVLDSGEHGEARGIQTRGREDLMGFTQSDAIEVKQIKGKGRGVFARRLIYDGEVIERVPVLVLPVGESRTASGPTPMSDYCFDWGRGTVAVALGYGSLYNHSYQPNALRRLAERTDQDLSWQSGISHSARRSWSIITESRTIRRQSGSRSRRASRQRWSHHAHADRNVAAAKPTRESHMGISCERTPAMLT